MLAKVIVETDVEPTGNVIELGLADIEKSDTDGVMSDGEWAMEE